MPLDQVTCVTPIPRRSGTSACLGRTRCPLAGAEPRRCRRYGQARLKPCQPIGGFREARPWWQLRPASGLGHLHARSRPSPPCWPTHRAWRPTRPRYGARPAQAPGSPQTEGLPRPSPESFAKAGRQLADALARRKDVRVVKHLERDQRPLHEDPDGRRDLGGHPGLRRHLDQPPGPEGQCLDGKRPGQPRHGCRG